MHDMSDMTHVASSVVFVFCIFHNSLQEPSILAQRQNRETSPDTGAVLARLDQLGLLRGTRAFFTSCCSF